MNKFDKIYEEYKNKYTSDIINEDIIKNLFFKMRSFPYFEIIAKEFAYFLSNVSSYKRSEKMKNILQKMKNKQYLNNITNKLKEKYKVNIKPRQVFNTLKYLYENEKELIELIHFTVYKTEVNDYVLGDILQKSIA